jgi:uncharacterized membrane protein YidH (DUF202 family)
MAKKKKAPNIINIEELEIENKIEIDYDKLAEAIVKANEKQANQYSVSREWMKFIIQPVFWCVAGVTGLLAVAFLIYGGTALAEACGTISTAVFDWSQASIGFLTLCIGLFLVSLCLATFFTAKEIDKEKDRNYVATMFSNMVALVALILSLIALVKG